MTVPTGDSDDVDNEVKASALHGQVLQAGTVNGNVSLSSVPPGWLIFAVVALVLVAAGLIAVASGAFRSVAVHTSQPDAPSVPLGSSSSSAVTTTTASAVPTATTPEHAKPDPATLAGKVTPKPAPAPAVHAQGAANALTPTEGIDLDDAERQHQDISGVDISFSASVEHLNTMDGKGIGAIAVLGEAGPAERGRCERAGGYARQQGGMTGLAAGRNICVKTSEGRYSMLTITVPAKSDSATVSFSYVTWS